VTNQERRWYQGWRRVSMADMETAPKDAIQIDGAVAVALGRPAVSRRQFSRASTRCTAMIWPAASRGVRSAVSRAAGRRRAADPVGTADGWLRVWHCDDLIESTVEAARAALAEEGSIAVIAADHAIDELAAALTRAGLDRTGRITALPASPAKGLEYDHVLVVEPADIVAAGARRLHRLYVVVTRAVSRLDILHHRPLPAAL
jgi:hypothetical protein